MEKHDTTSSQSLLQAERDIEDIVEFSVEDTKSPSTVEEFLYDLLKVYQQLHLRLLPR